jgi:hypothetical protein
MISRTLATALAVRVMGAVLVFTSGAAVVEFEIVVLVAIGISLKLICCNYNKARFNSDSKTLPEPVLSSPAIT